MLIKATDGIEQAKYIGEYLLKSIHELSHQIIYSLMNDIHNYDTDMPINKIKGIIELYKLIFDDGNMGIFHGDMIKYYLYLSSLQYTKGYGDDAFSSLDKSLNHAKKSESLQICEHKYTSQFIKHSSIYTSEFLSTFILSPESLKYVSCNSLKVFSPFFILSFDTSIKSKYTHYLDFQS